MREYRDSGIEWIGKIPENWEVCKLNYIYRFQTGATPPSKVENYFDGDIKWANIADLKSQVVYDTNKHLSEAGVSKCNMNISPKGSLMYSFKLSVGAVAFCGCDMYTNEAIATFLQGYGNLHYLYYMSQVAIINNANYNIYGAPILNQDLIQNALIINPPVSDQQRIADYLDSKCGEIDSLIGLQEQMIEKLKAYKQSVITEVVTKGLDPNAKLVPSGIDWIGEIPDGWKEVPLKSILQRRSEKNNPVKTKERLSLSIDKGVTLYAEKTTNLDRFKDDFTQYQLAYPNDIVLNSMNMIVGAVGLSYYFGCVSPVYYVVYSKSDDIDIKYYSYLLNTQRIRDVYHSLGQGIYAIERGEGRVNTCRLKVSYDDFGVIRLPVPPIMEQRAIVSHLDEKCADIDRLISLKQQKIEALKDYKKSVIYEAVTGKTIIE